MDLEEPVVTTPKISLKRYLFAGMLMLFVGVASVYALVRLNASHLPTQVTEEESISITPTSATTNWASYRNSLYGYTIKYPPEIVEISEVDEIPTQPPDVLPVAGAPIVAEKGEYVHFKFGVVEDQQVSEQGIFAIRVLRNDSNNEPDLANKEQFSGCFNEPQEYRPITIDNVSLFEALTNSGQIFLRIITDYGTRQSDSGLLYCENAGWIHKGLAISVSNHNGTLSSQNSQLVREMLQTLRFP